jgi:tetratricopeptide (TPR) repeat protein
VNTFVLGVTLALATVSPPADDAADCFSRIISADSRIANCTRWLQEGSLSAGDRSSGYNSRGIAYSDRGSFDRAIGDFSTAIKLRPDNPMPYNNRGVAHGNKGDYGPAIADLSQAIRLKPDYASAYANRGFDYSKTGDLDKAIADFSTVIELSQRNAGAYSNRGTVYFRKGDFRLSVADYTTLIDMQPDLAWAYRARGRPQLYLGDVSDALADFRRAVDLDPSDARSLLWLEIAARRSGQPSQIASYQGKVDLARWPGPIISAYLTDDPATARSQILLAAANGGDACDAWFYVGQFDRIHQDKAEAEEAFQHALAVCPTDHIEYASARAEVPEPAR